MTSDLSLLKDLIPDLKGITLEYGDITSIDSLRKAFADKDVVFNLAGIIKGLKQEIFDRVNVDGYKNVCEALLEVNPGIQHLIMFSSITAAGPSTLERPLTEDDEPHPLPKDMYGISKAKMEKAIKPYMDRLPITIVRPPMVFGAGDVPSLDLFKTVKTGIKALTTKETQLYSVTDVTDLCEGVYLMGIRPESVGQVFYLTTGDPIDWGELQELLAKTCFHRTKPLRIFMVSKNFAMFIAGLLEFFAKFTRKVPFLNKMKFTEGYVDGWAATSDKAKKLLGWQPRHTIESTLQDAFSWYKKHD